MQEISNFISAIGFPVAMCVALLWKLDKSDTEHKEEVAKLSDVISANTLALQRVADAIGQGGAENGTGVSG